jgi:hypothetical protein
MCVRKAIRIENTILTKDGEYIEKSIHEEKILWNFYSEE